MASLGRVVRLLQQYSERKDQQYEKEASNFHLLQHKFAKIEDLEGQLALTARRYDEITTNAHSHSLRLEQLARSFQERQGVMQATEERLTYETQEITQKL